MLILVKGKSPLFTTGKDDWETPPEVFDPLDAIYHFILDAAANARNHKVNRWYGPGGECANALRVTWPVEDGNIWLNPPYSKGLQARFVRKAWQEIKGNPYSSVVCLLPARTDTKLFHEVIQPYAKEIRFWWGRIKFLGTTGSGQRNSAPFPSMIVVF